MWSFHNLWNIKIHKAHNTEKIIQTVLKCKPMRVVLQTVAIFHLETFICSLQFSCACNARTAWNARNATHAPHATRRTHRMQRDARTASQFSNARWTQSCKKYRNVYKKKTSTRVVLAMHTINLFLVISWTQRTHRFRHNASDAQQCLNARWTHSCRKYRNVYNKNQ